MRPRAPFGPGPLAPPTAWSRRGQSGEPCRVSSTRFALGTMYSIYAQTEFLDILTP